MKKDNDNSLLESSLEALNNSTDRIDAHTLSRLNQARQKALLEKNHNTFTGISWLPASTLATLALAIIVGTLFLSSSNTPLNDMEEVEFMASNEDIELMEDLEFIAWLIEEDHAS